MVIGSFENAEVRLPPVYVRHFTVALKHTRDGRDENVCFFSAAEILHDHFSNNNASVLGL